LGNKSINKNRKIEKPEDTIMNAATEKNLYIKPVLGIVDILVRIRIPESVPLTNGSVSGSDFFLQKREGSGRPRSGSPTLYKALMLLHLKLKNVYHEDCTNAYLREIT
jgi:hypothetical protein